MKTSPVRLLYAFRGRSVKPQNVNETCSLIAAAKAQPGELRFGSTGMGTGTHLGIEKFNLAAGIDATHVPARGSDAIADTIANTIAGRTDYALSPIPTTLPHIRAGTLLPLGVSGARARYPTFRRWRRQASPALISRSGTGSGRRPPLQPESFRSSPRRSRALSDPALRASLLTHGGEPMSMTRRDFTRSVLGESESAARIIEAVRIKPHKLTTAKLA